MIVEQMRDRYHHAKWGLVLRGLLGIAIGLLIVARPVRTIAVFALITALWALFDGIVRMVHAFDRRGVMSDWWMLLISGLVGVIFGLAALYYYPALSLSLPAVWTALWLITAGWPIGLIATFGIFGGIAMLIAASRMHKFDQDLTQMMHPAAH